MIVRFGYTSADDDGNSFALQPRRRPMPGFGSPGVYNPWRPPRNPRPRGLVYSPRNQRPHVGPDGRVYLSGFGDILSGDPLGVLSSGSDGSSGSTDPGDPSMYGTSGGSSPSPTPSSGSTTDPWDPGQAAWGIPSSGGGSPTPGSTGSTPTASAGGSSPGAISTIGSILGLIGGIAAPKPAVVAPSASSSLLLPILLVGGGLGLVALLISSKKRA